VINIRWLIQGRKKKRGVWGEACKCYTQMNGKGCEKAQNLIFVYPMFASRSADQKSDIANR
jgi:hypothetical protein